MGKFREGVSNFIEKIKSIFRRRKVTEEKSADLFNTLTSNPAQAEFAPQMPQAGAPIEVVHSPDDLLKGQQTTEHQDSTPGSEGPSAMAA